MPCVERMFSPDDKKKEQALIRKVPVGSANPGKSIPLTQLADPKDTWLYYLKEFSQSRTACGLRLEKSNWVLFNKERAAAMPEPQKTWLYEFLREVRKSGRLIVTEGGENGTE